MEDKLLLLATNPDDDCVARVVASLIPRDEIEMGRQQIDDLAFSLISPLCANDCKVHEDAQRL